MMKLLGLFVLHLLFTFGGSERATFKAAVLEKRDETDDQTRRPAEVVQANLDLYSRAAEIAAEKNVDIIIFSEFGIHPYIKNRTTLQEIAEHVPDPRQGHNNPCNQRDQYKTRTILLTLSCLAQERKMYIVANMLDIQPELDDNMESCDAKAVDGCKDNIKLQRPTYNTNVAFNRNGDLIARYHKHHLYFEWLDTETKPDYATFKTDFGLFGMIVCFDSVFKYTADLIQSQKIDTLLFLTHWFDDIVPLNGIEWQQAMAFGHNVNVLGANGHYPGLGTLGSGIFSKKYGALGYTYNPDGRNKLVIAEVPVRNEKLKYFESEIVEIPSGNLIVEKGNDFPYNGYFPIAGAATNNNTEYRYFKSQTDRYTVAKLEGTKNKLSLCSANRMCCTLKYEADTMTEDYYLAVFNGTNDVKRYYKWQDEMCLLVRCDQQEQKPCISQPSTAKTVFKYVKLSGTFASSTVFPTVSTANHRLVPKFEWDLTKKGNITMLTYVNKSKNPLLKVAIYGRLYKNDPLFIPVY